MSVWLLVPLVLFSAIGFGVVCVFALLYRWTDRSEWDSSPWYPG